MLIVTPLLPSIDTGRRLSASTCDRPVEEEARIDDLDRRNEASSSEGSKQARMGRICGGRVWDDGSHIFDLCFTQQVLGA